MKERGRNEVDAPVVSFVIPTYNRAAILVKCLQALNREQETGIPFEIIVVDDGSSDNTVSEVQRIDGQLAISVRLLCQENQGPAAARNRGIEAATGELIIFLGDDIIVKPGYLAQLYGAYQARGSGLYGILGHTAYSPDSITTPLGRWLDSHSDLQFAYRQAQADTPLQFSFFYTSNILVPRQLLLEVGGFNEGFRHAAFEDIELGYRLASLGFSIYYCPFAAAIHVHPVSLRSTASRMKMIGRAALQLRDINPELFAILTPNADRYLAHTSPRQRFSRWLFGSLMVGVLNFIDEKLGWRMPGWLYSRTMHSVQRREMARFWSIPVTSDQ